MILKRLANNFRKQDWFSFFLELSILVLGIYLAFQVTEWQKHRENQGIRKQILVRLSEDLRNLEQQNKEIISRFDRQLEKFDRTIEFVKNRESWSLDYSTWRKQLQPLMGYSDPVAELPVYQELLATAQFGQITDQKFRVSLTSFAHQLSDTIATNNSINVLYAPAYQNLFEHLVDRQEFPETTNRLESAAQMQMIRDLHTMRNAVSLIKIYTSAIVKQAQDLNAELQPSN